MVVFNTKRSKRSFLFIAKRYYNEKWGFQIIKKCRPKITYGMKLAKGKKC